MRPVSAWGRLNADPHRFIQIRDCLHAEEVLRSERKPGLPRGMGRSYGDVCLNPGGTLWGTTGLDRFVAFDSESGRLRVEAGVLLRDIQRLLVPRGWALPVTPGTQWVTIGGAIANDVHGKNHHAKGSFGDHLLEIRLLRTDGEAMVLGPNQRADWFRATIGGLGLTGLITSAEIQLQPIDGPWLDAETQPYAGLPAFFEWSNASETDWEHTVSWIDCLGGEAGRGLFMRARPHGEGGSKTPPRSGHRRMPFVPPVSLVNALTLRPFNEAYYRMGALRRGRRVVHYEPFSYPLDHLHEWNRMYGPKGFYQYQSVVPPGAGLEATKAMLREIQKSGEGSFLAVLKTFGDRVAPGLLSFPRPGVTLALDFPNRGEVTLRLFERLDAIIREARGTLYPAKDARMPKDLFESGYPELEEFLTYRDPGISSALSRRLIGV